MTDVITLRVIPRYVVTYEVAKVTKKEHIHCVLVYDEPQDPKVFNLLRTTFTRKFPLYVGNNGKKSYSQVKKPLENLCYICKDKNFIKYQGFTEEELLAYSNKWVTRKQIEQKGSTMIEQLRKYIEDQEGESPNLDEEAICDYVLDYYHKNNKAMDIYRIRAYVNSLWYGYDPMSRMTLRDRILQKK